MSQPQTPAPQPPRSPVSAPCRVCTLLLTPQDRGYFDHLNGDWVHLRCDGMFPPRREA